jgi:arsenate reductase
MYHNPRCSKSRQTLELLRQRGIEPEIVEYLKTPPDQRTLEELLAKLGLEPRELMRQQEEEYQRLGLEQVTDRGKLIQAMAAHPILIERPIVVKGERARLGRPPEKVLEIF